jgi:histidinol-phosphate aminotransferase
MKNTDRSKFIRMDANENPYGCAPAVVKTMQTLSVSDISVYPDTTELIEKIGYYLQVDSERMAVSNGSDDIIRNIFDITVKPGKKVVVPVPTFSMNTIFLGIKKVPIIEIATDLKDPLNTKEIIKTVKNESAALIIIVNPTVPYGQLIKRSDIEKLLKTCPETTILVDEAYGEFSNTTVIDLTEKYPNLIVTRTFSKAFGLAGVRIGYSVSSPETARMLRKSISPYSASTTALKLAVAALENTKWMKQQVKRIVKNRESLFSELKKLGLEPIPTNANYITILSPIADKICDYLKSENILVRYFDSSGGLPQKALRISIGTEKENRMLIKKLKLFLKPQAIIFDMDGVLVDVSASYIETIKRTVKKISAVQTTDREIEELRLKGGFNNDWMLSHELLKRRSVSISYAEVVRVFQEIYLGKDSPGLIEKETLLIKESLLKKLSKKYPLALFTGRPRLEAEFVLNRFKIGKYFSSIVTMNDVAKQKPDPQGAQITLKNIGVISAIYFGDTVDDMLCAKNSGCIGIGISSEKETMVNAGAAFVLNNINEAEVIL